MATAAPSPHSKKPIARVLVVEDQPDVGDLMRLALTRSLIDATLVSSAETALARLNSESYDLILVDIALPGMSGLELCEQLQADPQLRHLPVIIVSGEASPANKAAAERLGVVEFIEKPVRLLNFLSRVMGQLQFRQNRSEANPGLPWVSRSEP